MNSDNVTVGRSSVIHATYGGLAVPRCDTRTGLRGGRTRWTSAQVTCKRCLRIMPMMTEPSVGDTVMITLPDTTLQAAEIVGRHPLNFGTSDDSCLQYSVRMAQSGCVSVVFADQVR